MILNWSPCWNARRPVGALPLQSLLKYSSEYTPWTLTRSTIEDKGKRSEAPPGCIAPVYRLALAPPPVARLAKSYVKTRSYGALYVLNEDYSVNFAFCNFDYGD